ncbi:pheromone precursor [Trametes coccinea BRFM310]|uniref:Pheromone n=1 Tax=Trametes coccinea (strain BRFM310) TaxID=1353009 RepID=A0A1Y2IRX5_TRAC3|nr:pheromone precursor [Trametes coccinea BRFM310]
MDEFDTYFFTLSQSSASTTSGPIAPVLPNAVDGLELSDELPRDYDHRSNGFGAVCIIA